MIKPIINYAITKAKKSKMVQNIFEAPFDLNKYKEFNTFTDSYNNTFKLLSGLRTKIKPGWEGALNNANFNVSKKYLKELKTNGNSAVKRILPLISTYGKKLNNSNILEVGCHSGASSYSLADIGAKHITASEFIGYKVESLEMKNTNNNKLIEVSNDLKLLRSELANLFNNSNVVNFIEDDICNSSLPNNSFDIILNWDVLEHLHNVEKAFNSFYNLLNKNGIAIIEYNPFFGLNGGHSLCTLDFLWGHTRLSKDDFEKYLDKIRPNEKDKAFSFYIKGLNRMTIDDLKNYIELSGLELLTLIPFIKEQHLKMIDNDILSQTQLHYPSAKLIDLASSRIIVVVRKN